MTEHEGAAMSAARVVSRDPEVHSGDLVFAGTRVPVKTGVSPRMSGSRLKISSRFMTCPTNPQNVLSRIACWFWKSKI